jgi:hypothetical protein
LYAARFVIIGGVPSLEAKAGTGYHYVKKKSGQHQ